VGKGKKIRLKKFPLKGSSPARAFIKKQALYYKGRPYQASVFEMARLSPGNTLEGPALVADSESTTFLPPSYMLQVDGFLNLVIQRTKK